MSGDKPVPDDSIRVYERMFKRNRVVEEATQDVIAAYEQLAEAKVKAAKVSADPTSTPGERADADAAVYARLNRIGEWMCLLRNRLEERASFATEFGVKQTRE